MKLLSIVAFASSASAFSTVSSIRTVGGRSGCVSGTSSFATIFLTPTRPFSVPFNGLIALEMAKHERYQKYVPCFELKDLRPGSATSAVAAGLAICIAVTQKGSVYALGDKCPPANQPLSRGKVEESTISDPVLGTTFSLKTGEVVEWCSAGLGKLIGSAFTPSGVPTYPVRQRAGKIEIQVDLDRAPRDDNDQWSGLLVPDDGTYS